MRFMVLMIPKSYRDNMAPGDKDFDVEAFKKMGAFNDAMAKAGLFKGTAEGLQPLTKGARVSFAGGKPKVTDGPFVETKEVLGGYWMIDVKSKAEAVDWMTKCPAEDGDIIEIRQVYEMADFPAHIREALK
jgi:hypothetical protein